MSGQLPNDAKVQINLDTGVITMGQPAKPFSTAGQKSSLTQATVHTVGGEDVPAFVQFHPSGKITRKELDVLEAFENNNMKARIGDVPGGITQATELAEEAWTRSSMTFRDSIPSANGPVPGRVVGYATLERDGDGAMVVKSLRMPPPVQIDESSLSVRQNPAYRQGAEEFILNQIMKHARDNGHVLKFKGATPETLAALKAAAGPDFDRVATVNDTTEAREQQTPNLLSTGPAYDVTFNFGQRTVTPSRPLNVEGLTPEQKAALGQQLLGLPVSQDKAIDAWRTLFSPPRP